jgi:hypothetical protein
MKKYNKDYSQLSKIILVMSENQQRVLLKMAHKIISDKGDNVFPFQKHNGYWLISLGVLSGWILAATVMITFLKII